MSSATDTITRTLTGELPFVLIAAATLALPVSLFLLWLYRRAVLASMLARAKVPSRQQTPSSSAPLIARAELELAVVDPASVPTVGSLGVSLHRQAMRAPWQVATVYVAAGLSFALIMAFAFLLSSKTELLPVRLLVLFWIYAWPIVLTIDLVAASTRRVKLVTIIAYFAVFAIIALIALARSSTLTLGQLAILWTTTNLPPTVLLLAFLNHRVRAVGPLVLTMMLISLTGSVIALSVLGSHEGALRAIAEMTFSLGLGASGTFIVIIVLGFAMFGILGWLVVTWIRKGYEAKKTSDQSITLDVIWLFFGVTYSVALVFEGAVWILSGIIAFIVYKLAVWAGLRMLGADKGFALPNTKLLLLRVFSLGKRSARLFDVISKHWRYVGSVQLIAGPDLATTTVEPHEFLGFLSGKIARLFINGKQALDRKIAEIDTERDFDYRFRVNDFFCHDNTWQMVLSRLVTRSDVILMDLRGFSPQNAGCIFELDELINVARLRRVLLVIDETTDLPFLKQTLQQSWNQLRPDSPNRTSQAATVTLFRLSSRHTNHVSELLRWLSAGMSV